LLGLARPNYLAALTAEYALGGALRRSLLAWHYQWALLAAASETQGK